MILFEYNDEQAQKRWARLDEILVRLNLVHHVSSKQDGQTKFTAGAQLSAFLNYLNCLLLGGQVGSLIDKITVCYICPCPLKTRWVS